jgi:hypothetical protein
MAPIGVFGASILLIVFIVRIVMVLLGLTPEQRTAAEAKRAAKDADRKFRDAERASRKQRQAWAEEVARQNSRGKAGFADEAEARAALSGKGGRPSNLDDRWF